MRPQVIIITLAVLGILAALPLGKGHDAGASSWPCCDNCGVCNWIMQPSVCQCKDISPNGCHPECKNCVKLAAEMPPGVGGIGPVTTFRCDDKLTNFCQRNCTPAAAAPVLTGGVF